jgi:hypothetical protein
MLKNVKGIIDKNSPYTSQERSLPLQDDHPAYKLPDTTILGIPRSGRLRKDSHQVIYHGASVMDTWCIRLVPAQVVVLSLFDGQRTLCKVAQCVGFLSDCDHETADKMVRRFLRWIDYPKDNRLIDITQNGRSRIQQFDCRTFLIPERDARISVRLDKPESLILMPTDRCQTDCVYCYACRRRIPADKLLSIKRIHDLIEEAAEMDVCLVNLDGGDVMCRRENEEIIAHLCERNIRPVVSTKAHISKDRARRLRRAGLGYIQVGLDAPLPEMADYLVRRRGFLGRTIKSICNLVEAGITTRTNSIITAQSLHLLPELVDFLMTLPLNNIKVAPAFRSLYRGDESVLLTPDQKRWYRMQMKRAEEKYPGRGINWECTDDI